MTLSRVPRHPPRRPPSGDRSLLALGAVAFLILAFLLCLPALTR